MLAQPIGRVHLPELARLGNDISSLTSGGQTPGTAVPWAIRPNDGTADVYALKRASMPSSCPQSQLDVYELLSEASQRCGEAGLLSFLAAIRSLSTLHRGGLRILSPFEVLVFTYHWCLRAETSGCKKLQLADEGWRVFDVGSVAGSSPHSDAIGSSPASDTAGVSLAVEEGTGNLDQTDSVVMRVEDGTDLLRALLVVAIGSRAGEPPSLPRFCTADSNADWSSGDGTSGPSGSIIDGLKAYAKETGPNLLSLLSIPGERIAVPEPWLFAAPG